MDTQIDRPSRALIWAVEMFGDIALDRRERVLRFVEEAIELAEAMSLTSAELQRIMVRVFNRPSGNVARELGQCQVTLECLAKAIGIDLDAEATKEFQRVHGIPKDEWERRHAAKVAIGIAKA